MAFLNNNYDTGNIFKYFGGIVSIAALMYITGGAGFVIVPALTLIAIFKNDVRMMCYWLAVANCMLAGNSALMPKDIVFSLSHRGMMVMAGAILTVKVFGRRTHFAVAPLLGILPYMIYIIIPSSVGWSPIVSYLKIALFLTVFLAYVGVSKLALSEHRDLDRDMREIVLSMSIFFLVGSVLLIPFPHISYMGAEEMLNSPSDVVSLYKGMTWHSQTLSPLVSSLCVFLLSDLLFSIKRVDKLYMVLILICPFLVVKTASRTGMGALIVGIAFVMLQFRRMRSAPITWKRKVSSFFMFAAIGLSILILILPSTQSAVFRYVLKWDLSSKIRADDVSIEKVLVTRQKLMDESLRNWSEKPLLGNGFQVSEGMRNTQHNGILSYLSAPIEKGVWVTAVLEEGGVIGLILFCVFWISAVFVLAHRRCCMPAAILLTLVAINLGEFSFFSMTSEGGLIWSLVFTAAVIDGTNLNKERSFKAWQTKANARVLNGF